MKFIKSREFLIIETVKKLFAVSESDLKNLLIKGIGDDCAVIEKDDKSYYVISTDALIEDVHFIDGEFLPFDIGYKCASSNLSDIAAMGAIPVFAFMSVGMSEEKSDSWFKDFLSGFKEVLSKFKVMLVGGDLTSSPDRTFVSVTVVGTVEKSNLKLRSGADAGDRIFVSGKCGDSSAFVYAIKNSEYKPIVTERIKKAQVNPVPEIEKGIFLGKRSYVSAMIDVSDGVVQDLAHILEESKKGAKIFKNPLLISDELNKFCKITGKDPFDFAFYGGEDYKLLFTVRKEKTEHFMNEFYERFGYYPVKIGEVIEESSLLLKKEDGSVKELSVNGYTHF